MHEFKLTIKLDNKDYCNGCPLMDYFTNCCKHFHTRMGFDNDTTLDNHAGRIRLDICKESEVNNG